MINNEAKRFPVGVHQISNDEYHASDGISRSGIMALKESTLAFYELYIAGTIASKKQTEQMILGSLIHTLVLEPHKFNEEYVRMEKATGTGSRAINAALKERAVMENKVLIDDEIYNKAVEITKNVLSHPKVSMLMSGSLFEQSFFWIDKETEILCKARP